MEKTWFGNNLSAKDLESLLTKNITAMLRKTCYNLR